jgi:hypothetical protein
VQGKNGLRGKEIDQREKSHEADHNRAQKRCIGEERNRARDDCRDKKNFLLVHRIFPVHAPRHHNWGGPHGRIGEIGDEIKYRMAFKSIAFSQSRCGLYPFRRGFHGVWPETKNPRHWDAGDYCCVPPKCCIQELFAPYRRAAGLTRRARHGCGCSSGVEHNLAKVGVEGSNPFARSKNSQ